MKSIKGAINPWTLKFENTEIEQGYQSSRISFRQIPLIGKIVVCGVIAGALIRRVQLVFDAYYGSKSYNPADELRLTLELFIGFVLELIFGGVPPAKCLRGTGVTIGAFLSVVDSSCFYYPAEPALAPMYFVHVFKYRVVPLICSYCIILLFYTQNWIVTSFCLMINSIIFVVFMSISYKLTIGNCWS